jgi:hypothetical protein
MLEKHVHKITENSVGLTKQLKERKNKEATITQNRIRNDIKSYKKNNQQRLSFINLELF